MTFEILFVLLALLGMVIALVLDKMRPGMVLFSVVVLFLCAGILTPKEMLEGFSNKGNKEHGSRQFYRFGTKLDHGSKDNNKPRNA